MVNTLRTHLTRAAGGVLLLAAGACTVHDQSTPPLSGPSTSAVSLQVTAAPDSITQDGMAKSTIQVFARDTNGPKRNLTVRLDMNIGGAVQDYGTLSAKTIMTDSNGYASSTYTAPAPLPPNAPTPTCQPNIVGPTVTGQCVNIVATPVAGPNDPTANFQNVLPVTVTLRLVPAGTILPPGVTPYATFSLSTNPVNMGVPVTFDASLSCWTALVGGVCPGPGSNGGSITSYSWTLGDGTTATGQTVTHTYTAQQTFTVTLTVTNNTGISASTTQTISVGTVTAPKPDFVYSPTAPTISDTIFFNADTSVAATGHQITTFNWNFGDGQTASGFTTSHKYTSAGTYNVVLSVMDDTGQKATTSKTITVVLGNPIPVVTFSPTTPASGVQVYFDATASQIFSPATSIVSYLWNFGDGTIQTTPGPTNNHAFSGASGAAFTVSVTVTDNANPSRSGTATVTVTLK